MAELPEVRIEVVPAETYGQDLAGPLAPELFSARSGEIADSVAEVAKEFRARIDEAIGDDTAAGWRLGQGEVSFGLQAQAGAGVLIATASPGPPLTPPLTCTPYLPLPPPPSPPVTYPPASP